MHSTTILSAEPKVRVGIMTAPRLSVTLHGQYLCNGQSLAGKLCPTLDAQSGKIKWNGDLYDELMLIPQTNDSMFDLDDVTIGVNFHWQRRERQRFSGALKLAASAEGITAINLIAVESYLLSVISSEMSANASVELLKAHAVISRSWLLAQMEATRTLLRPSSYDINNNQSATDEVVRWYDRDDHTGFDVCADDHCQRYQGVLRQTSPTVAAAVAATRGRVLMHDGFLCDARFSKCCGGAMELFENCWEPVNHPYMQARSDSDTPTDFPDLTVESNARRWILGTPKAYCNTTSKSILAQVLNDYDRETANFYRWTVEYGQDELASLIAKRSGIDFGRIIDLIPIARGTSGRIYRLKIVGTKRTIIVGKELEIRKWLSPSHLYSSAFVVETSDHDSDGVPGLFSIKGAGWGHGAGLCQIGAAVMGAQGISYDRILSHYFPGASLNTLY